MGIFDPQDPPENGIGARKSRSPLDSHNKGLPVSPVFGWGPIGGPYIKTIPSGPGGGHRPMTLGEALREQQRGQNNLRAYHAAWAMEEERNRQAANRFAPSPSYVPRYQQSPEEIARQQKVRDLYQAIVRGNSQTPLSIPYNLAKAHGIFSKETTAIEERLRRELVENLKRQEPEVQNRENELLTKDFAAYLAVKQKIKQGRVECVRQELSR
jgi:hypothetical protein